MMYLGQVVEMAPATTLSENAATPIHDCCGPPPTPTPEGEPRNLRDGSSRSRSVPRRAAASARAARSTERWESPPFAGRRNPSQSFYRLLHSIR